MQSSHTLAPGIINLGLFLNYAVNSLPYLKSAGQTSNGGNGLLGMDLNAALGITPIWEVGFSAPFILAQHVADTDIAHGQFAVRGNTELRPDTKVRVYGNDVSGVALVGTVGINTTTNNPYRGRDPGADLSLEAAGTTRIARFNLGLKLGYRWMRSGSAIPYSFITPLGNQWIASAAGSYLLEGTQTKLISEIYSGIPASDSGSDSIRASTSLDILFGMKHDISENLAYQAGLGAGLIRGVSSPDIRIYAGLNYAFGPVFGRPKGEPIVEKVIEPSPAPQKLVTRGITFDFDSVEMTGNYQAAFEEFMQLLAKAGNYSGVVITGFTDSMGSAVYNQKLSERRAGAIREYLIKNYHLDPKLLTAVGKGAEDPVADNGNFQGRLFNRRVEFVINK